MKRLVLSFARLAPLTVALLWMVRPGPLTAQATEASIGGLVADSAGPPIGAADVVVTHRPTGRRFATVTDAGGRFTLFQLPVGGPYRVLARRVGYRPAEQTVAGLGLGERPQLTLLLVASPTTLEPIQVTAAIGAVRDDRIGGSVSIDSTRLANLPAPNRSFSDLATLSPWTGPQLSLGGGRWTQTEHRLDGVRSGNVLRAGEYNAGPFGPPLEAIREFEVNTNVYDVAQGRQGGGEVAAVTRSGTNVWRGAAYTGYRSEAIGAGLDYQNRSRRERPFTTVQWGGSIGGPIVRDRIHLFAAFERQDGSTPLLVGLLDTPAAEQAAGIARDSLDRILSILSQSYGTADPTGQVGRLPRKSAAMSLFGRIDWTLSPSHLLTVRHLAGSLDNPLSGGVDQPIAIRESRSSLESREHQALASLRSTLSSRSVNELRLSYSHARRELTPESVGVPRGFVQVRSSLPDGTIGNTTIQFGGNRLAPDRSREWQLQLTDLLFHQAGPVELVAGTDNAITGLSTLIAEAQSGLFVFPSIAALASRTPNRFTRTVPLSGVSPTTSLTVADLSLFAQATWHPTRRVAATVGLRWDATAALSTPAANPIVAATLGIPTDRRASDWFTLAPRGQVVWDPRRNGSRLLRLGAGLFSASLPAYSYHNELLNTGLLVSDIDLRNAAVPVPDYPAYRSNPLSVPGMPTGTTIPPYLNLIGNSFRLPSVWKASVAYRHRFTPWLTATGTVALGWARGQYHYLDQNLRAAPSFTLASEGGRGIWVPAATIAANGLTDVRNAFANPALGRVLALESVGRGRTRGLGLELSLLPESTRFRLDLGYLWNRARDNSTFGCCLARTAVAFTPVATDPRDLSDTWAPADLEIRHRIIASGSVVLGRGFSIAGRLGSNSGRRYSLVVDGDLNGDEVNGNDLAFLFDPDDPATPADVAASMRTILADDANLARDYIAANLGRVSHRNGLVTPWVTRLDLRIARQLRGFGVRGAILSVDLFNALNLVNSTWGAERALPLGISSQNPIVNRVPLLRIVGFDQTSQRFRYAVNEQAGVLARTGDPYQFQISLRIEP